MLRKEIKQLHLRLEQRILERDTKKEDNDLFLMAESDGWRVFSDLAKDLIAELLEGVDFAEQVPLDVRGAIGEARGFAIEAIRKLLNMVESTRAGKKFEKQEKASQQENENI